MKRKSLKLQIHLEDTKHTQNTTDQMDQSTISELSNDEGIEKDDEGKFEDKEEDSLSCLRACSQKEDEIQRVLKLPKEERSDEDVDLLVDSFKHMGALSCMSQSVARKLCAVMFVIRLNGIGSLVLPDDAEVHFWYIVLDGELKNKKTDGSISVISIGESFGVCSSTDKQKLQVGEMTTNSQKCELGCVEKKDFIRIFQEYQESMLSVEENGEIVMVLERKSSDNSEENIVIQGTKDKLIAHLMDNRACDPNYLDDFLLTYRVFIEDPCEIMLYLLDLFKEKSDKNKISRVILHWVNAFHKDFEKCESLQKLVSRFKTLLNIHSMKGSLKMLEMTEACHAKARNITLTRSDKNEPLGFVLLDGREKGIKGVFVKKVQNQCKVSELGMKQGDQILKVNNRPIDHLTAKETYGMMMALTHISIQLKYNYQVFREIADHEQEHNTKKKFHTLNPKVTKKHSMKKQNPESMKLSKNKSDYPQITYSYVDVVDSGDELGKNASLPSNEMTRMCNSQDDLDKNNDESNVSIKLEVSQGEHFKNSTFSPLLKAKSFFSHSSRLKGHLEHDLTTPQSPSINKKLSFLNVATWSRKTSTNSIFSPSISKVFASSSQPDIFKVFSLQNSSDTDVIRVHFDSSYKNLYINQETDCKRVVELAVAEFGLKELPKNFNLCEVIFEKSGLVRTKTLPAATCHLSSRSALNARYFLKHQEVAINIPEDMSAQVIEDSKYDFADIPHSEVAIRLTVRAFELLQQVDPTEHVVDLFKKDDCTDNLQKFSQFSNQEMFWVPTVLCSEANINKRCKLIKQFIKIAKSCKRAQNFNSFFSIISGLRHGSVERLRNTWEKMNPKDLKYLENLQSDMDPTRNMARYRRLLSNKSNLFPAIPFYPIFKKDLTFIDLGNDTITKENKLINFDKMRMVSSAIRSFNKLTSGTYMDNYNNFKPFQVNPSSKTFQSKSYEMSIQTKKAAEYIQKMEVITDEEKLYTLSYQCEPSKRQTPSHKTPYLKPSALEASKTSSDSQSLYIISSPGSTLSSTSTNTLSSITTSGFSSLSSLTSSLSSPRLSALSSSTLSLAPKSTHMESTF